MRWFERFYKEIAVYWSPGAPDGFGGRAYGTPIEIKVHWRDIQELFVDAAGEQLVSKAIPYVDRELADKGYLYLGKEADLDSDHSDPKLVAEAYEIKAVGQSPDIKAIHHLRKVWL